MPYIDTDGARIYYEVKGNPAGKETVAFLNGVMASAASWMLQTPVFEKFGFKIILHDFRGQLLSDKPPGPYSFRQHVRDAKALFDYLDIAQVHLVGTSYGGEAAMRFAIDLPERVKTIAVINSVSELDNVLRLFINGWKQLALKEEPEEFFWGMAPTVYGNSFLERNMDFLQVRSQALKKAPADYFRGQLALYDTFLNDVTMTGELGKIRCPALVVAGENDLIKPRKFSEIIAARIPGAEYAVIPDCGHVTIFEKPDILNSLLLGFILKNCRAESEISVKF